MIGIVVANLLIPGDPQSLDIATPTGVWTLTRQLDRKSALERAGRLEVPETYIVDHPASAHDANSDQVFYEITPLLLAFSYVSGAAVTSRRSSMSSEISIFQPTEHWPRPRAMGEPHPMALTPDEFRADCEIFMRSWYSEAATEKMLLLIHHWLDALSSWSLESLYLSATTLLQIIAATQERRSGQELTFFKGVKQAFAHYGLSVNDRRFVNMRNALVHEGELLAGDFANNSRGDAGDVAAAVLNMFDEYVHAAMRMGKPRRQRFSKALLLQQNAFSIHE